MRKLAHREAGVFNPRLFLAFTACCFGLTLAMLCFASTPSSGTLTDLSGPVTYTAGPFNQPNPSPLGAGQLDTGPRCNGSTFPCDNFDLTLTLPAGFTNTHPNAAVKVTMSWTDAGTGKSDYDLYIYKGVVATTDGSQAADYQSASGGNPEVASISVTASLADGAGHHFSIKIVPYTPSGETVQVKAEFLPGATVAGGGGFPGFGGADPTVPGAPRFRNFYAPKGTSAEDNSGEFNIGFNPQTGRIMVMNSGPIWRLTPPERFAQPKPECCEALWEDRSSTVTNTGLDPILWTDQKSGRTFASNSTVGANAVYAYSDSDGEPTATAPTGWIPFGVAAPNGGADHETIGSGPYPAALSSLATALNQGETVYYCSQDIVGPAACYRSDTLGSTYGPGTLAYNGQGSGVPGGTCGGLHGHIHVAPDGTAWLPVNQCSGRQGGVFSTDGGVTWVTFQAPNGFSQQQGADPSIAIDANSNVYYGYVKNEPVAVGNPLEGHAHVAVGHRNLDPLTQAATPVVWTGDIDVGINHGVVNAAEIEAVGGSNGRAAVGFLGTDIPGDYQALSFPGDWYAFIAMTYDGGQTWTTINATPNDPVQHATGVWQQGGGAQDRNLLDFNEITLDDKGHVLYGYSDGCTSAGCVAGTAPNDYTAFMRVARQSGGKSLLAQFDVNEPIAPKAACLSGTRDATGSLLTWKVPDNGGANIISYRILRSTTAGGEVQIAIYNVGANSKAEYFDATADPNVRDYFYTIQAVNSQGAGVSSNEIDLSVVLPAAPQSPCSLPGVTLLIDSTGDSLSPAPGTDMMSASIAQPFAPDGNIKFVVTMKTDPALVAQQPNGSAWYVAMKVPSAAGFRYTGVRMEGSATGNAFYSYVPGPNGSGGVDGRFVDSKQPAEATSSYDSTTGTIRIVVKASDLGLAPGDTIVGFVAGSSQSTDIANLGAGATEVWDPMPDSLAFTGSYTVQPNNSCSLLPAVTSRKTHGSAGVFDINLPISGGPGVEDRVPTSGGYTLVFRFPIPLTSVGSASVTGGSAGGASGSMGSDSQEYVVQLSNVPDQQNVTVTLSNVSDQLGDVQPSVAVTMRVLVGDTNADSFVNAADSTQTQNNSGQLAGATNFRTDVNGDGVINSADATIVRNDSGHTAGSAVPRNEKVTGGLKRDQ